MELQHHGIKGMRWGVRRFQKKDGSLTPSGKKRYGQDSSVVKKDVDRGPDTQIMDEKMKAMDGKSLADYVSKNVSEEDYTSMNKAIGTYMDTEWELDDALHGYGDVKAATGKRNDAEKILRSEISKQSKKYMDIDFDPNGKFNNVRDRDAIERYVVNMEGSYDELKRMSHSDMLMHHGIKGMRWGVRRYRNYDGSLTAAGKRRIKKDDSNYKEYEKNKTLSDFYKSQIKAGPATVTKTSFMVAAAKYDRKAQKYLSKVSDEGRKRISDLKKENLNSGKSMFDAFSKRAKHLDDLGIPAKDQTVEMMHDDKAVKTYVDRSKMFKKHPDLYDDFGGPGQIDDDEYYDMVLRDKGYK